MFHPLDIKLPMLVRKTSFLLFFFLWNYAALHLVKICYFHLIQCNFLFLTVIAVYYVEYVVKKWLIYIFLINETFINSCTGIVFSSKKKIMAIMTFYFLVLSIILLTNNVHLILSIEIRKYYYTSKTFFIRKK